MTIPVKYTIADGFVVLVGNPTMTRLDGLAVSPLSTILSGAFSQEERAEYGVYLAIEFVPDVGYHTVGEASYSFPDPTGFPYYVQQTYSVEADEPPPPTLEERVTELEAQEASRDTWAEEVNLALAAMPTKATNAPPAVAGASALGNVEVRYALENHTHEINGAQQSAISANQSAISALQTLTGGLNTPNVANADPSDLAATAAQGASSRYARQDHAHKLPVVTPSTGTSRSLGTAWQPSATKAVEVTATINISTTTNVGGVSEGIVQCLSDSATTPTTLRTRVRNRNAITLAIALQQVNDNTFSVTYLVPAGHYILFAGSGTGTFTNTLERVTECVIG